MNILAYVGLAFAGWIFSQWAWNRAAAAGGHKVNESRWGDLLFAISIPIAVASLKVILS